MFILIIVYLQFFSLHFLSFCLSLSVKPINHHPFCGSPVKTSNPIHPTHTEVCTDRRACCTSSYTCIQRHAHNHTRTEHTVSAAPLCSFNLEVCKRPTEIISQTAFITVIGHRHTHTHIHTDKHQGKAHTFKSHYTLADTRAGKRGGAFKIPFFSLLT